MPDPGRHTVCGQHCFDISTGLLYVTLDVHSEARCLRNGEPEIERNDAWDTAYTNDDPPAVVDMFEVCW